MGATISNVIGVFWREIDVDSDTSINDQHILWMAHLHISVCVVPSGAPVLRHLSMKHNERVIGAVADGALHRKHQRSIEMHPIKAQGRHAWELLEGVEAKYEMGYHVKSEEIEVGAV